MIYLLYDPNAGPIESEAQPTGKLRNVGPVTVIKNNGEEKIRYQMLFEEGTKLVWALPDTYSNVKVF